jgi:hypothetical protein
MLSASACIAATLVCWPPLAGARASARARRAQNARSLAGVEVAVVGAAVVCPAAAAPAAVAPAAAAAAAEIGARGCYARCLARGRI